MDTDTISQAARNLADALDWIDADTDVRDAFPGVALEDIATVVGVINLMANTVQNAGE